MMNISHLVEIDPSLSERNITEEVVKKPKRRSRSAKKNNDTSFKNINNMLTKRSNRRLTKKLKKSEGKNYNRAVDIVNRNYLHLAKPVQRNSIPKICLSCKNCVKLFGFCDKYNTSLKRVAEFTKLDKCTLKEPIKY